MKFFSKSNILASLVVLLLLANTATLVSYWVMRSQDPRPAHVPPMQPSRFLIQSLKLDKDQQEKYMALVKEHQQASQPLREQIRESKENLFQLLHSNQTPDSLVEQAAAKAGKCLEDLDLLTFRHFREVRKICTPPQQEIFDKIIHQMLDMMAPRGRPEGPGSGRPPGGGHGPMHDGPPPME